MFRPILSYENVYLYFIGQVGLNLVILDAKPNDMQEYGSEKFMLQELTQKVNKIIEGLEIRPLKCHLTKHNGLSKDCVVEPFKKGSEETSTCNEYV